MSCHRLATTLLLLVSLLGLLTVAGTGRGLAATTQLSASHDETRPHVMQIEAQRQSVAPVGGLQPFRGQLATAQVLPKAAVGGAGRNLSREVFGFALGSSLSDPTVGYPAWNFDLLSTVAYFGLHVLWDGTFQDDSSLAVWNSSQLGGLVSTAHAHGVKVVLTIINGDSRSTYPNSMCDALLASHHATTIRNAVAEVKAKGVDGLNVDYEGNNQACNTSDPSWARHRLSDFIHELRAALGNAYYLSIDTYSGAAGDAYGFFDIPVLNLNVDSFFVMAYDMEYANYHHSPLNCASFCLGPTSPLTTYYYNDTDVMAQYSATVTAAKVILGIPYYGRKACVASGSPNQAPQGDVVADMYVDAATEATDPAVRAGSYAIHRDTIDAAGQVRQDTWYSSALGCTRELYWDDTVSLRKKYDLVNADGLRGVGIWSLNYGGSAPELWDALASSFGSWAARFDMSRVPTSWVRGQSQTFPVTAANIGGMTWPSTGYYAVELDLHFASYPGGSAAQQYWLSSLAFSLPSDVAPGANATVNVTLTPNFYGHVVLEAEMVKEHQFWFQQWQPVNVNVAPAVWSASYNTSTVPTSWMQGTSQTFPVTVTNTGNVTWPSTGYYAVDLDLHFASYPGGSAAQQYWLSSLAFSLPSDVAPGASVTVNVTLTPSFYGHVVLEAEMIKEHQFWFQQFAPVNVNVARADWLAAYDMSKAPTTWKMGQGQSFPVTLTNGGAASWPSTGYYEVDLDLHFASYSGGAAAQRYWLSSLAFSLPSDVAPGASVTVNVTLTPHFYGHVVLEAEMVKEHQFWFPQWQPVDVNVSP